MLKKTEKEIMKNWSSQDKLLVSCCCITYNHENFISMALDGMLMQETDFPFEIIVRDDCSTDQTAAIIKKYAKEYSNIIRPIFEKENQYSKGINGTQTVIEKARGKYIAFLDGDDYWRDEFKLQKQVDFLEKKDEYVLSYHNSIIVNENNEVISKEKIIAPTDYSRDQMLCAEAHILTNTVMFRNVKINFPTQFGEILNGDTALWHLLGYYGKSKYQNEIKPAAYRVHTGGVWSGISKPNRIENSIKTQRILRVMLKDNERLTKRITTNIDNMIVARLFDAIRTFNFSLFKYMNQLIIKDDEINGFIIYKSLVKLLLKKTRSKCLKIPIQSMLLGEKSK